MLKNQIQIDLLVSHKDMGLFCDGEYVSQLKMTKWHGQRGMIYYLKKRPLETWTMHIIGGKAWRTLERCVLFC